MRIRFMVIAITTVLLQFVFANAVFADEGGPMTCGALENHFGPFDYRTAPKKDKDLVERFHFTRKVESLAGGNNAISAGGDMAYTLHVFPNHHKALMALIKLGEKEKTIKPRGMAFTVPCYFDRAERFRPDDATVKSLFGVYLLRSGKNQEAQKKLEEALELAGDNANVYYNLGLAYYQMKMFDQSLEAAHRAYALGFPLPGLRDMLKRAGKWQERDPQQNQATSIEGKEPQQKQ